MTPKQINTKESNPIFSDADFAKIPNISRLFIFFVKDFFYWWYIQMPIFYLEKLERISLVVADQLSISILFKNFFVPWKRHRSAVGYFIGILVKLLYLPIAIAIYLTIMIACALLIFVWVFLPPVAIIFVLISLFII